MLKLGVDEDFNNRVVRGVLRRVPDLDFVRIQDAGLDARDDPSVLEWAASEGRVLVTHDVTTMRKHAYARISAGLPMPGVFEVAQTVAAAVAIEEILILAECSVDGEWEGQLRSCLSGNHC